MIKSMLDNDLYKFTMMQAVLHQFPGVNVEYDFKCRTEGVDFREYVQKIEAAVTGMCSHLSFSQDELDYLSSLRFIKPDFVQFLKLFKFDRDYVDIRYQMGGDLVIKVKGPWLHTILFEVPILAIVSEVYSEAQTDDIPEAQNRLVKKIELIQEQAKYDAFWDLHPFKFADFGTRRRYSFDWQFEVVADLKASLPGSFVGTSNVLLAKEMGLKPIGTMAHEWLQAHQALGYQLVNSQKMAFENWAKEYRGDLGIALSDVIGLDEFLYDFDMYFAKLFDGTRQDSGDPYEYGEKLISHYESMGIDPATKTVVFSDGLTMKKAIDLWKRFSDRINVSFGIGTHLTNDFDYSKVWPTHALQIVLKMVRCNGQPVAKLSNSPGKTMCKDEGYLEYLRSVFRRE